MSGSCLAGYSTPSNTYVVSVLEDRIDVGTWSTVWLVCWPRQSSNTATLQVIPRLRQHQRPPAARISLVQPAHDVRSVRIYLDRSDRTAFGVSHPSVQIAEGAALPDVATLRSFLALP